MMLATAASETSVENGNRPQPNSLEKVFNSSDSGCESLRQFLIKKYPQLKSAKGPGRGMRYDGAPLFKVCD